MRFKSDGDIPFQLHKILNGGIEFKDNVRGGFLELVIGEEEQEVIHGLDFAPIGFLIVMQDGPGDVWARRVEEWDRERLYLQSNVTNLTVRLFVM